jgi:hypothetical protein
MTNDFPVIHGHIYIDDVYVDHVRISHNDQILNEGNVFDFGSTKYLILKRSTLMSDGLHQLDRLDVKEVIDDIYCNRHVQSRIIRPT